MYGKSALKGVSTGRVKKRPARRFGTKKRMPLTTKAVARIARSVTLKAAETKSYFAGYNLTPLDNSWNAQNLIYPIAQGSNAENVIGEKMFLKNIRFKGWAAIANGSTTTATRIARMVVFATKKALTNSSVLITTSDLCRTGGLNYAPAAHIDLHKVDVLYDNAFELTPGIANQSVTRHFDINVPINKTVFFDADNSGYLKNKNYYMAIVGYDGNGVNAPVQFTYNFAVNFKDE